MAFSKPYTDMSASVPAAIPESEPDDEALVLAARIDPEAFGKLMERYEAPLTRYLMRLTGWASEEVEDILQEAFIKAYRNLNDYDSSLKFSAWLYRITHNQAIDILRRHTASPVRFEWSLEDMARLIPAANDTQAELITQEHIGHIRRAIAALPERYREVLVLRFLEEKSYEEIVDILKMPKGSVATAVKRGKELLHKQLEA
ncbi:MAG: RNA polymerase sigma factor [Undibacterium sp.]